MDGPGSVVAKTFPCHLVRVSHAMVLQFWLAFYRTACTIAPKSITGSFQYRSFAADEFDRYPPRNQCWITHVEPFYDHVSINVDIEPETKTLHRVKVQNKVNVGIPRRFFGGVPHAAKNFERTGNQSVSVGSLVFMNRTVLKISRKLTNTNNRRCC